MAVTSLGIPSFVAQALRDPALRAAAQNAGHDFERGAIFVAAQAAQMADRKEGLLGVLLLGQEEPRRGRILHLREFGDRRLLHRPIGKQLFDRRLHLRGIEIAPDAEHDVGRKESSLVERAQVAPRNAVERAVLLLPAERSVLAVDQAGEFAARDGLGDRCCAAKRRRATATSRARSCPGGNPAASASP